MPAYPLQFSKSRGYHSEYQGGGLSVLKRLPEAMTIEALIDIAMTSNDENDIIGASLELSEREKNANQQFRNKLLDRLLIIDISTLTDFEKERIRMIIYESELYDPTNRCNIIGKSHFEIQEDASYYRMISEKAKEVLAGIGNLNNKFLR